MKHEINRFILRRERVPGIRVSQGFSKQLSHHVGKVISKFYPFYSYLFCDFRGARFFERATRNNSKTSFKTNFFSLCLTHSESLKHSFVLKGYDSPNCVCEMAFYHFSVSFTQGNESASSKEHQTSTLFTFIHYQTAGYQL